MHNIHTIATRVSSNQTSAKPAASGQPTAASTRIVVKKIWEEWQRNPQVSPREVREVMKARGINPDTLSSLK